MGGSSDLSPAGNCGGDLPHQWADGDNHGAGGSFDERGGSVQQLAAANVCDRPSVVANPGSVGHPYFCHSPCLYFRVGKCERGDACGFCHHCDGDARGLDPICKQTVRQMDRASLDVLLATVVRDKLHAIDVLPSGLEFVQEWYGIFSEALPEEELLQLKLPGVKPSSVRRLLRNLHCMSLHKICGVACTARKDSAVVEATEILIDSLRDAYSREHAR